jgi:hypothetical protein
MQHAAVASNDSNVIDCGVHIVSFLKSSFAGMLQARLMTYLTEQQDPRLVEEPVRFESGRNS